MQVLEVFTNIHLKCKLLTCLLEWLEQITFSNSQHTTLTRIHALIVTASSNKEQIAAFADMLSDVNSRCKWTEVWYRTACYTRSVSYHDYPISGSSAPRERRWHVRRVFYQVLRYASADVMSVCTHRKTMFLLRDTCIHDNICVWSWGSFLPAMYRYM